MTQYETDMSHLHRVLEKVDYMSTTADGWTTKHHRTDFLGMTAHWLEVEDDCVVRKSAVLVCKDITATHT